jgi:hypothetical protein
MTAPRLITFTKEERERIAPHCKALGITFAEFVHDATMHMVDEMDGLQRRLKWLDRITARIAERK